MRTVLTVMLLCLLAVSASGCWLARLLGLPVGDEVPYDPKGGSGAVSVQRDIQFADIPAPRGFRLDRSRLFSYKASSFRFGTFHYDGGWSRDDTAAFYDEQMPLHGWTKLTEQTGENGVLTQIWAKGDERVRIVYDPRAENLHLGIRLMSADEIELAGGERF